MRRKAKTLPASVTRLGDAKRLTRGIFGPYLELNGNMQTVA